MIRGEGEISKPFEFNVLNTLGRNQKKNRNMLYQQALSKPDDYLKQRNQALELLVDSMVKKNYDDFRAFLSKGTLPDGSQLNFPDGKPYMPCLPDASLTKFAMSVAETIEEICENAMEEVMPMSHKDLAIKKISDISKIKGLE